MFTCCVGDKLGTDDKTHRPGTATGRARPGQIFSCVGVTAGLMRKVRKVRSCLAEAGACGHDTERCCKGVQSTFFPAPSRLNGLRGLRFEGEAGEPVYVLLGGPSLGKGAFVLELLSLVCVSQADL